MFCLLAIVACEPSSGDREPGGKGSTGSPMETGGDAETTVGGEASTGSGTSSDSGTDTGSRSDAGSHAADDVTGELAASCTFPTSVAGHLVFAHFLNPSQPCAPTTDGFDWNVHGEFLRLVASVPAGGTIRGNISSISADVIAKALLDAQTRGVDVYITGDGKLETQTGGEMTYLNALQNHRWCLGSTAEGPTYGCLSDGIHSAAHTKLFTFSSASPPGSTKPVPDVVWFGSANFTYLHYSQNTVTVYGDEALYDGMTQILTDMYEGTYRGNNYYDSALGRGYVNAASANVYASPEQEYDIIVSRLNDVTPDPECRVRVQQASIRDSRLAVVDHLVAMKAGGCQVEVVADFVGPQALAKLKGAGIAVRHYAVHDKVFVVYGKYDETYRYKVYTGSHNLSGAANSARDEIFVALDGRPLHDAFYLHFRDAFDNGTPL